MTDTLDDLLGRVHKDVTEIDHEGSPVPCIVLSEQRFADIMRACAGRAVSVNTNLDILRDGRGHVFVEVKMDFSTGNIQEKVLLDARKTLKFFESLAKSSILALSPKGSSEQIFMIQLPRPERAKDALTMIREGLG